MTLDRVYVAPNANNLQVSWKWYNTNGRYAQSTVPGGPAYCFMAATTHAAFEPDRVRWRGRDVMAGVSCSVVRD